VYAGRVRTETAGLSTSGTPLVVVAITEATGVLVDFRRDAISLAGIVPNTMAIMKIITELRAGGETILDEDLARISPLMHQHVIPNGTYHFARYKPGDEIA
jgi:Tn3 transposase DDE domain